MPATYVQHRAQLKAILRGWDMPEDNAEITAEVLAWSDLHGVDSHGISMIPGYDTLRRRGRVRMDARPRIVSETPVSVVVDGGGGLGHVPAHFAMRTAIAKAKTVGMAAAVVRGSAHFGAAGFYTLMAANAGLVGMACTSASGIQVAPTFGRGLSYLKVCWNGNRKFGALVTGSNEIEPVLPNSRVESALVFPAATPALNAVCTAAWLIVSQ